MNLKICVAQINTTVGNFSQNRAKILEALRLAQKAKADLITFPEATVTGYPPEDLLFKKKFIDENLNTLRSILPYTAGLTAAIGFVDRDKSGRIFNAAAIFANKKWTATYRKTWLPNYGVFDEKRYFAAGNTPLVIRIKNARVGLSICEDIWQQESFVYRPEYAGSVSLLVNISASPYQQGKEKEREALLSRLARKVHAPVVYHNLVGGQDELVFDGGSMILDASGKIIRQAARFEEEIFTLDMAAPTKSTFKPLKSEEEVYRALILGTRDYIRKNGFKKVLLGLSGGIDSALVGCLAVDAIGKENVIGVTMPSQYTSNETYRDAKQLAKNLGIECLEFKIKAIFDSYRKTLKTAFKKLPESVAEENLQTRIRGNLLMALSNKFGHLVLTTGNKSEIATGYCTLYGDMAGGFAVIKDVPKTLVFRLARYRNSLTKAPAIPPSIIKRPPTAELKFNQRDQDTLPPYETLDRILDAYVEKDLSYNDKLSRRVAKMVDKNEYKRRQAPPGVKITPKAFGRDRRMPITHNFD